MHTDLNGKYNFLYRVPGTYWVPLNYNIVGTSVVDPGWIRMFWGLLDTDPDP
jgi:hypothetical protein